MDKTIASPENTPVIYITGFGPFGNHKENASEKVVKKLTSLDIESELKAKLVTDILDVAYEPVLDKVPSVWKSMKPKLVVHVGVSELAQNIVLERQAFNEEYAKPDVFNCSRQSKQCVSGSCKVIQTQLDLDKVIFDLQKEGPQLMKCSVSLDPGRYLCGFVYYLSLSIDKRRSLFIHVPPLHFLNKDPEVAATKMARTICALVKKLYPQVMELGDEQ